MFLIKEKFEKSINTYDKNAIVQKEMADKLISLINKKDFDSILEIGSYTGLLTKKVIQNFNFKNYLALDIVDSFDFIKNLNSKIEFKLADINNIKLDQKFDLIITNACLQWCDDLNSTLNRLKSNLNHKGILAFTTFGIDNLKEIKEVFSLSLNYLSKDEIKKILPDAIIIEQTRTLEFKNAVEALRHLKLTGVNSLRKNCTITKQQLKTLGNKLTFNPIYVVYQK